MNRMTPEARVGLLVLAGVLLLVFMSLKLGKLEIGAGGGYGVTLRLDSAVGLVPEAEVLVAGISVGRVERIDLDGGRARLTLRIRDGVELPVDTVGSLRTHGVLGEKYVELVPGRSGRMLADGGEVGAGAPPGDLDRLVSSLTDISADVKRITERLANVLGTPEGEQNLRDLVEGLRDTAVGLRAVVTENRAALRETIANLRLLSAELGDLVAGNRQALEETLENTRRLTGRLDQVVAENRDDLRVTMANLRVATGQLTETLSSVRAVAARAEAGEGTLGKLLQDDGLYRDLEGTVSDLRAVLARLERGEGTLGKLMTDEQAYDELRQSLANLSSISGKIDRGEGTIGKLVNDDSVHENLNDTLEGIGEFVGGALKFRYELGFRSEYLADQGDWKSYAHLKIQPRQDRFYYLELVDDPQGDTETETTVRTITENGQTRTVTEEETVTRDRFKFTAMVGKQFSNLTLRGGMIETSAGAAADLDLWSDRVRLTFEAFDFGRDGHPPHLKLSARWHFLKFFYLTGGLDDFIDTKGLSDYFLGAGLRFQDDDLKYLLSPAVNLAN